MAYSYDALRHATLVLLHNAAAAVCPINGVSIPDLYRKDTWSIDIADEATKEQRLAVSWVIGQIDVELDAPGSIAAKKKVDDYILKAARALAAADNDDDVLTEIDRRLAL